jgi:Lrp/AsnC family leucine-responsive transcriptional regulator
MAGQFTGLDPIDRRIVDELVKEGRLSVRTLAERIALSSSATSERVRRLEEGGVIRGYRAVLSAEAVGRPVDSVIGVRATPNADRAPLEAWFVSQPSVVEVAHLTGPHDYLVRARCRDMGELDSLLMRMKSEAGVAETETRIVLRTLDVEPQGL